MGIDPKKTASWALAGALVLLIIVGAIYAILTIRNLTEQQQAGFATESRDYNPVPEPAKDDAVDPSPTPKAEVQIADTVEPAKVEAVPVARIETSPRAGAWVIQDLGIEFVRIEPGTFVMGTTTNDPYRNRSEEMGDGAPTTVTITKPFWITKTETTVAQYEAIMGTNSPPRATFPKDSANATTDVSRLPAANMTWEQAMEFCAKLTERERAAGRLPAGHVLSLPSEAQWEYAARAGTRTRHYAGDATDRLSDIAWFVKTVAPFTRKSGPMFKPVATKKPNAWGLYDMIGNVREWCRDWYAPLPGGAVTDWRGPASPYKVRNEERPLRVCKGGSWIDGQRLASCGARDWFMPSYGSNAGFREGTIGFRVAAVPATEVTP